MTVTQEPNKYIPGEFGFLKVDRDRSGLGIYRLDDSVQIPTKATKASACYDLRFHRAGRPAYVVYNKANYKREVEFDRTNGAIYLYPEERVMVPTGLIFDIPRGWSLRVHIRSSLALKSGLFLANSEAVVDEDYVDETFVMLYNASSQNPVIINEGDRIAQYELVPVASFPVDVLDTPPARKTDRDGGFGSTGKA